MIVAEKNASVDRMHPLWSTGQLTEGPRGFICDSSEEAQIPLLNHAPWLYIWGRSSQGRFSFWRWLPILGRLTNLTSNHLSVKMCRGENGIFCSACAWFLPCSCWFSSFFTRRRRPIVPLRSTRVSLIVSYHCMIVSLSLLNSLCTFLCH